MSKLNKVKDFIKKVKISDIQEAIKKGNQFIKTIHGLKEVPALKENVDKITENKYFKKLETGLNTAEKVSGIYSRIKDLKINNVIPNNKFNYDNLNRIGEENALEKRKKYLEEQRLNKGILKDRKNSSIRDEIDANRIAMEVK